MKRRLVSGITVTSLLLLMSVAAQASPLPVQFGIGGGMSMPVGDAKDAFKTGFHAQAMAKWSLPAMPIGFRTSLGYQRMDLKSLTPGFDGTGSILSGLGNVTLGIMPAGPIRPYLLAGVGAYNTRTEVSGAGSVSSTKFGIDGGAGVEFKLGTLSGFVEGKVENIFTDQGLSTALGSTKEFKTMIIPVTFGVYF